MIGNGNVAADVARILTLSIDELERTDVADHALEALRESRIREVIVLGRRGPAQAAFTSAELRELGRLDGVDVRVDPGEVELDPVSLRWLDEEGTFTAHKNVELLRRVRGQAPGPRRAAADRAALPALPGGDPRERRRRGGRRPPQPDRADRRRCPAGAGRWTTQVETFECGLALRSVGYRAVPLPDVPFDDHSFVLPNERGRVLSPEGEPIPGVYAVGWIKRGPTGILGTNKRDAEETTGSSWRTCGREGCRSRRTPVASRSTPCWPSASRTWSRSRAGAPIAAHELEGGRAAKRPRVKLASRDELLAAAAGGTPPP